MIWHDCMSDEVILFFVTKSNRLVHNFCNLRFPEPERPSRVISKQAVELLRVLPPIILKQPGLFRFIFGLFYPLVFRFVFLRESPEHVCRNRSCQTEDDVERFSFRLDVRQVTAVVYLRVVHCQFAEAAVGSANRRTER